MKLKNTEFAQFERLLNEAGYFIANTSVTLGVMNFPAQREKLHNVLDIISEVKNDLSAFVENEKISDLSNPE